MKFPAISSGVLLVCAAAMTLALLPGTADAAAYIKIEGIEGEAADGTHSDEIDVLSWSWGMTQSGASGMSSGRRRGGASLGRSQPGEGPGSLTVSVSMDASSPALQQYCSRGEFFETVEFATDSGTAGERQRYMVYELKNVMITSCSTGGSGGEDRLTENITLNYEEVEWTYQQQPRRRPPSGFRERPQG